MKIIFEKIKNITKTPFVYFLVFGAFFCLFFVTQFSFFYPVGSDVYYHIKQSWLIRTSGIETAVRNFSWLEHSILIDYPADLWLGYHFLLLPFTYGDLMFGAKLSSVFFNSFLFLGIFWLFKKFKIKYAFFWTFFLLLLNNPFNFRLLLPRPHVLSILFALVGFYFIFKKKYLNIFLLSFFYAFTTAEAPLIVFIALILTVFERIKTKKLNLKPLAITLAGFLAGLVFRPDFPNSFYFLYHQIFSVLYLKFTGAGLDVGNELSSGFLGRVENNTLLFLANALPLAWVYLEFLEKKHYRVSVLHYCLIFFSLFFCALSFLSVRFVELWVPFSFLSFVVWFNSVFLPFILKKAKNIKELKSYHFDFDNKRLKKIYQATYRFLRIIISNLQKKIIRYTVLASILFLVVYFAFLKMSILAMSFSDGPSDHQETMEEGAIWLKENTPKGSLVLNARWDSFPLLFFFNHHNRYCNGMDPTFMYVKNPELYWSWTHFVKEGIVGCGQKVCDEEKTSKEADNKQVYNFLKEELKGDYMFLAYPDEKVLNLLGSSEDFERVFKKGKIEIYRIKQN